MRQLTALFIGVASALIAVPSYANQLAPSASASPAPVPPAPTATPAEGTATSPAQEALVINAQREYDAGLAALDSGDDLIALHHFLVACVHLPTPVVLMKTAELERRLGKFASAYRHVQQLNGLPKHSLEKKASLEARDRAAAELTELAQLVARVELDIATGPNRTVSEIYACSVPMAPIERKLLLDPGECSIVVKTNDDKTLSRTLQLTRGSTTRAAFDFADFDLVKPPAVAPSTTATIATGPIAQQPHSFRRIDSTPPFGVRFARVSGVAVGVVGLGLGIIGGVQAMTAASKLERDCANNHCPLEKKNTLDSGRMWGNVSTVGFVLAGVGGLAFGLSYAGSKKPRYKGETLFHLGGIF